MPEDNAPTHVIGKGTIPIEADMSAFDAAMEKAGRLVDEIGRKVKAALDPKDQLAELLKGIEKIGEAVTKAATVRPLIQEATASPAQQPDARIPAPQPPAPFAIDVDREMEKAVDFGERREMIQLLTEIRDLLSAQEIGGGE